MEVTKEKSLDVSLETVKQKQPHTNGEMLAQSCLLKSLKLLLGEFIEAKMRQISFSNTTIQRRMSDMSEDENQVQVFLENVRYSVWTCRNPKNFILLIAVSVQIFPLINLSDSMDPKRVSKTP